MHALVFRGHRKLALIELPPPVPCAGEVLVQVARTAICGTDLHQYRKSPDRIAKLPTGEPQITGHEAVGWVAGLGAGVTCVRRGERVLLAGVIGCGICRHCQAGNNVACEAGPTGLGWGHHGCNADYVAMPARNMVKLDERLGFEAATTLACAGGTAMTALREAGAEAGHRVAVVGLGPVGLCVVLLARILGCTVAGIEPVAERRALAAELGADLTVDPAGEDPVRAISRWSADRRCDVVVECVGRGNTQTLALALAASRATVALAGLGAETVQLDLCAALIERHGIRLLGVAATPLRYFSSLVEIAGRHADAFEGLVTHHFALEQADEAFAVMENGSCGKVVLNISDEFRG